MGPSKWRAALRDARKLPHRPTLVRGPCLYAAMPGPNRAKSVLKALRQIDRWRQALTVLRTPVLRDSAEL